jgi:hypothetical protein
MRRRLASWWARQWSAEHALRTMLIAALYIVLTLVVAILGIVGVLP